MVNSQIELTAVSSDELMNTNSALATTQNLHAGKPMLPVWTYLPIGLGLLAIVAVLDVSRPFDRSWSILYVTVAFYASWFLRGRAEFILIGSVILAAFMVPVVFEPNSMFHGTGLFYRATGVVSALVMNAMMWDRRRYMTALQRSYAEMERKVSTRTSELQTANEMLKQEIECRTMTEGSLRLSEERFSLFMEYLPALAWIKDDRGRYVFANNSALKTFCQSRDQLYGKTDDEIFPRETAEQFQTADRQVLATGAALTTIETLLHEDGVVHYSVVNKFPLLSADSKVTLVGGLATDITERQEAENTIRKISAFREAIIRTAAEGICVCNAIPDEPYIVFSVWNDQMTEITGYSMDEINRLGWYQTLYPDPEVREQARQRMERMRVGDDLKSEEWEITRRDGERRTLAISTSIVDIVDGNSGVVAVIQDITKRKQDEFDLRASESRFRLLFEGANDAIFWADAETGIITHCNRAGEILLGKRAGRDHRSTSELLASARGVRPIPGIVPCARISKVRIPIGSGGRSKRRSEGDCFHFSFGDEDWRSDGYSRHLSRHHRAQTCR